MAYIDEVRARLADTAALDAFSRLRISPPLTLFDSTLQYDKSPLLWDEWVVGGGAGTHDPNNSAVILSTGAGTATHGCWRQTREYIRYQPGKSQLVLMTGVMGAIKANVRQRIGYFDDNNGLFFEEDGSDLKVVRRTYTSGSPADNAVTQANWNLDTMDGNGPSGITLDMDNAQIFVIDMQWLGVGRVRFGFDVDGTIVYCHEFLNANSLIVPYMTTANLPVRYSIENTGAAGSTTQMTQVCTSVISEGGFEDERGLGFTANNGITAVSVTTRRAILSIRPRTTLNSIEWRGHIHELAVEVGVTSQDALIELVYNPTFSGTPSWSSVDSTNSGTEYSVHGDGAAGGISGGVVVASFTAPNAAQRAVYTHELLSRLPITLDHAGTNPIALSIVATRSSGSGTSSVLGHFNWKEQR